MWGLGRRKREWMLRSQWWASHLSAMKNSDLCWVIYCLVGFKEQNSIRIPESYLESLHLFLKSPEAMFCLWISKMDFAFVLVTGPAESHLQLLPSICQSIQMGQSKKTNILNSLRTKHIILPHLSDWKALLELFWNIRHMNSVVCSMSFGFLEHDLDEIMMYFNSLGSHVNQRDVDYYR